MTHLTIDWKTSAFVTTVATLAASPACASRVGDVRARMPSSPGLRGAAIHASPDGNSVFEYFQWQDEGSMCRGAAAVRRPYEEIGAGNLWFANSKRLELTPGPNQPTTNFSLRADPSAPKPTLVSYIACDAERQSELTSYLLDAANRFTTLFGGWIGAALHPRDDGRGITEYLQFDSIELMAGLQERAELVAHKNHLARFGVFQSQLLFPVSILNLD